MNVQTKGRPSKPYPATKGRPDGWWKGKDKWLFLFQNSKTYFYLIDGNFRLQMRSLLEQAEEMVESEELLEEEFNQVTDGLVCQQQGWVNPCNLNI